MDFYLLIYVLDDSILNSLPSESIPDQYISNLLARRKKNNITKKKQNSIITTNILFLKNLKIIRFIKRVKR